MKHTDPNNFSDRLKSSAEAKKALLDKFRPKASVTDPLFTERAAMREAELDQVRADRAQAKADAKQATAEAEAAVVAAEEAEAADALEAKRGERRERKALTKVEAKAKRDARYAARKARQ